jgi:hypothetical protein
VEHLLFMGTKKVQYIFHFSGVRGREARGFRVPNMVEFTMGTIAATIESAIGYTTTRNFDSG